MAEIDSLEGELSCTIDDLLLSLAQHKKRLRKFHVNEEMRKKTQIYNQ